MKPVDLAKQYMDVFYSSNDFESLHSIFAENLDFEGPLFCFSSAKAYIAALVKSPPGNCNYQMLEIYEKDDSVCLLYKFIKNQKEILMSQFFWVSDGLIVKIRLIFNPQASI